jgi:uncharacterized protein YcfJ
MVISNVFYLIELQRRTAMDIKTVLGALLFGLLGSQFLGGLLNMPDGGAILAIAFIGGRIVSEIRDKKQVI